MTLVQIPPGTAIFVDANVFVYHFAADPGLGPPCSQFLNGVYAKDIQALTSSHVLSEVAHRLMTVEALKLMNWPVKGIAARLRKHPEVVKKLTQVSTSLQKVSAMGVQVVPIEHASVLSAAALSLQHGLMSGDALVLAAMQARGITHLASHDGDFDGVPAVTRYEIA